MKKVIVSGASGYIGRSFMDLAPRDLEIIALTRDHKSIRKYRYKENVTIYENDEFFKENLDLGEDVYLLNLAFPRVSDQDELFSGFDFTYRLYDKALRAGAKYIINISSQSVYDPKRVKEPAEYDDVRAESLYAVGKIYIEAWTRNFALRNDIKYVNLRLGSIIGPGFDPRIVNKLIKAYIENEDIRLEEKGEMLSYLYVDDACQAFLSVMDDSFDGWNQTYNVGAIDCYTVTDIMEKIERNIECDYKGRIQIDDQDQEYRTRQMDINKFINNSNWIPRHNLDMAIREIFEHMRENYD